VYKAIRFLEWGHVASMILDHINETKHCTSALYFLESLEYKYRPENRIALNSTSSFIPPRRDSNRFRCLITQSPNHSNLLSHHQKCTSSSSPRSLYLSHLSLSSSSPQPPFHSTTELPLRQMIVTKVSTAAAMPANRLWLAPFPSHPPSQADPDIPKLYCNDYALFMECRFSCYIDESCVPYTEG
jgi:hypothetical protein